MALDNLRALVGAIDAVGELVRVDRPVAIDRAITEIADRCMKAPGGGPALLFQHPTLLAGGASRFPVAVNLFGSERRMALALGAGSLDEIGDRLSALLNLKVPDTLFGKLAMLPQLAEVAKFPPKTIGGRAPCQETVIRERMWTWDSSRSRSAGPRTAGPTSRCRASSPAIQSRASATSGCTASR